MAAACQLSPYIMFIWPFCDSDVLGSHPAHIALINGLYELTLIKLVR